MKLQAFQNTTALITGGSSGIGKAAAFILAEQNCRLILTSENQPALKSVKEELQSRFNTPVDIIPIDLCKPGAGEALFESVTDLGCQVDILICSAGIHSSSENEYQNPASVRNLLQLHVTNQTELLLRLGADMMKRKRGYILTISSITSWFSDPASLIYGPSKSYISAFSRSLHCELKEYGIKVTCMKPGGVDTGFFSESGVYIPPFVRNHLLSPEECVKKGLKALVRGKKSIVPGSAGKIQLAIYFLCMRPVFYKKMKQLYLKKKYTLRREP